MQIAYRIILIILILKLATEYPNSLGITCTLTFPKLWTCDGLNLRKSFFADLYPPFLKYCLVNFAPFFVMRGAVFFMRDFISCFPATITAFTTPGAILLILCLSFKICLPIHISWGKSTCLNKNVMQARSIRGSGVCPTYFSQQSFS